MDWFSGAMAPFTIALLVAGGLLLIELAGALLGAMPSDLIDGAFDFDGDVDADADVDGSVGLGAAFGWMGFGRVPALVVLMAFLVGFGLSGVAIQWAADAVFGPLPGWLAAVPALVLAVPITRGVSGAVARILPLEETEASSSEGFVGRVATLGAATARAGLPAEAKLTDAHGQVHYVRVVPAEGDTLEAGRRVLLIEKTGGVFGAVPDPGAS